jgi:hypothetical protein
MENESHIRSMKAAIWGFFLIALGAVLLLERFGILEAPIAGHLWPAVFLVIGITHLIERRPGSAAMFLLLGAWFFACTFEWRGLSYHNSWPLVLVAVGAGMVIRALSGEDPRRRRGGETS